MWLVAVVECGYLLHVGGGSIDLRASAIEIQVTTVTSLIFMDPCIVVCKPETANTV